MACGSRLSPVWTSDAWTIVDDGAASQPKRSDAGSAAMAPASAAPSATRASAARWSPTSLTSAGDIHGASAANRAESSATRAARKPF